jgi:hypothetical protein
LLLLVVVVVVMCCAVLFFPTCATGLGGRCSVLPVWKPARVCVARLHAPRREPQRFWS